MNKKELFNKIIHINAVADPRGVCVCVCPRLLFGVFLLTSKNWYLINEYEICLKMLEMAILGTQIFKTFWEEGGGALLGVLPLLKILDPPLKRITFKRVLHDYGLAYLAH